MIEKLTPKQEAQISVWQNQWLKYGLCTKPADRPKAEAALRGMLSRAGLADREITWCTSPMIAEVLQNIMLNTKLRDQLGYQLRGQLRGQLGYQLGDQLGYQLRDQLRHQLIDQLGYQLGYQLKYYGTHFNGYLDAYWTCFYGFCQSVLGIKYGTKWSDLLNLYVRVVQSCGKIYWYEKQILVCERPSIIKRKGTQLHCDGGPALQYPDGWGLWALNGVTVSQAVAETPWDKLDACIILKETNAEVRREIVRKIGIEKVCRDLGAQSVEKNDVYELLLLDTGNGNKRPYLKMLNPSIGVYHIEGVPPECQTIEQALHSRKPERMKSIPIDDINGEDWQQQGDVCIWPKKAKSLKRYPQTLT